MKPAAALLLAWVGCSAPSVLAPLHPSVEVAAWIERAPPGHVLVVQVEMPPDGELEPPNPQVRGLEFEALGRPVVEFIGSTEVLTARYGVTGVAGVYEIRGLDVVWTGVADEPQRAEAPALWLDMNVEPPRPDGFADIIEPEPLPTPPWAAIAALLGGGTVLVLGLWIAFRRGGDEPALETQPEMPDAVALRRWDAVRMDPALDSFAKAAALSQIFRDYVEEVLEFPATAWTSTETLRRMAELEHLHIDNVPRAKRLLRATDRVKYAEAGLDAGLFEDLDDDLRNFVSTTRPHAWGET
jgi:hypothetical protein